MDMSFPHPLRVTKAGLGTANYSALVATATSRQASSRTVSALLTKHRADEREINLMGSRMAFFAHGGRQRVHGAFLPEAFTVSAHEQKFESSVNPADSVNGKAIRLDAVKPEVQVAERGTEF